MPIVYLLVALYYGLSAWLMANPKNDVNQIRYEAERIYKCEAEACLDKMDFSVSQNAFGGDVYFWQGHQKEDVITALREPISEPNTLYALGFWIETTFMWFISFLWIVIGVNLLWRKFGK